MYIVILKCSPILIVSSGHIQILFNYVYLGHNIGGMLLCWRCLTSMTSCIISCDQLHPRLQDKDTVMGKSISLEIRVAVTL